MDQFPPQNLTDHDIIVVLYTEIKNIKQTLVDIQNGTISVQNDHEQRLRVLELDFNTLETQTQNKARWSGVWTSAVVSILVGVAAGLIIHALK